MPSSPRRQVVTYVAFVFLYSLVFYYLVARAHSIRAGNGLYVFALMWCPALAALTTLRLNSRKITALGWGWGQARYQVMSWALPLIYSLIAYGIIWSTGLGAVPNHEFVQNITSVMGPNMAPWVAVTLYVVLTGSFQLARSMSSALGEEIGWRGFMVPELSKFCSFTTTSLISGVVWAAWHVPGLLWADYNGGTPFWYGMIWFAVGVISASFIYAWMRLRSGSLWTGVLLHASHNLYVQAIFTRLTRDTGHTSWYIDEFGAVLPLVIVAFAIYFWRRRSELPTTLAA